MGEELRTLFNGIFKFALACGIIERNPVALIQFKRAERQNRESLSKDEIKAFFERIKDSTMKFDKAHICSISLVIDLVKLTMKRISKAIS